jgi:eukaryotic-like serine/threonine-protein kinase
VSTRGPEDTNFAYVEFLACQLAMHEGDYELALRHCRRALTLEGLDTPDIDAAGVHATIATILAREGEHDEALASQRRAYDHVRQRLETDSVSPSQRRMMENGANHGLGRALAQAGQHEDALARLEQASEGFAADSTSWRRDEVEVDIGTTLLALGRPEAARARLRDAVAAIEARTGPESLELQRALTALGQAELEAGDAVIARKLAQRALGLLEARSEAVSEVEAGACFVLARSLIDVRAEHARAVALARRAEAEWAAHALAYPRELARVRAWLAEHGDRAARRPT